MLGLNGAMSCANTEKAETKVPSKKDYDMIFFGGTFVSALSYSRVTQTSNKPMNPLFDLELVLNRFRTTSKAKSTYFTNHSTYCLFDR